MCLPYHNLYNTMCESGGVGSITFGRHFYFPIKKLYTRNLGRRELLIGIYMSPVLEGGGLPMWF